MKHADFHIGLEFLASAGFKWRCTDIGTRTISAIRINRNDPKWYQGPPYIAKEIVFDEEKMEHCHLTENDAVAAALDEHKASGHPGYPAEVVHRMMEARHAQLYSHDGVLRFDRCRADGEILHPYAGRKEGETWMVELYLPFLEIYDVMAESDFIALPRALEKDIRNRAGRCP